MITRPPFEPPENGNLADALRGRHGFGEKAIKGQRISLHRLIGIVVGIVRRPPIVKRDAISKPLSVCAKGTPMTLGTELEIIPGLMQHTMLCGPPFSRMIKSTARVRRADPSGRRGKADPR